MTGHERSLRLTAPVAATVAAPGIDAASVGGRSTLVRRLFAFGLAFELLLILSLVPAPLVPLTADSGMDEILPPLEALGQPLHERLDALAGYLGVRLKVVAATAQLVVWLLMFIPYGVALRQLGRATDLSLGKAILCFGVLFQLTALLSRRMFSTDLFSYVLNGRILAIHGGDPYADMPAQFPDDPYLPLVVWREIPNHYGPLWTYLSAGFAAVGGEHLGLTFLLFRLVSALATIGVAFLIWGYLRRYSPRSALLGTALWAWNPLLIMEGAGSGHNDPVLALTLVAAVVTLADRRATLGCVALAAGLLLKYSAAVLGPTYAVAMLWQCGWRRFLLASCTAAALAALSFLAFWRGDRLPAGVYVSSPARYLNSPTELVYTSARRWLGDDAPLAVERVEFRPWWAAVYAPTELMLERGRFPLGRLPAGTVVLATGRPDTTWQPVIDPVTRETGFVRLASLRATARPSWLGPDDDLATYEAPRFVSPVAELLNRVIRLTGWAGVGLAILALIRSTRSPDDLLAGWMLILTLVYVLVATWFFPWYLIWGLAIAGLRPRGPLVWGLVASTASALTYYAVAPFEFERDLSWLYDWRAIPMFLPLLAGLTLWFASALRRRGTSAALLPASGS